MATRLITPPAVLPVTLAEAKSNLRIDDDAQDSLITAWIEGITSYAEHETGRSIINQGWRVTLDKFPTAIELPPPVYSVSSVEYLDPDGIEQTLDPADYIVDAVSEPGYVVPGVGKSWPETYDRINSVMVDVVSGYGPAPEDVPPGLRLFILAKLTEQFDPAVRMEKDTVQSSFIDKMLDRFKVYF